MNRLRLWWTGRRRREVQAYRSVACIDGENDFQLLNESILYFDRTVVTEVCLYCDTVQATVKERKIV